MSPLRELSAQMVDRLTRVDPRRDAAQIAVVNIDGANCVVGVARYALNGDGHSCAFTIVVADDWQRHGLGFHLLSRLVATASERGLKRIRGDVLAINRPIVDFASARL